MLTAEQPKHPIRHILLRLVSGHHQLQTQQISMMQMRLSLNGRHILLALVIPAAY